jgi:GT2 family glycosyltransferase
LASLQVQALHVSIETIVVDNASADGSAEMVQAEFPEVCLIKSTANRGFAAANNTGMAVAKGRYCLLLNPDTIVLNDCLKQCVEYSDKHPDIGVLGCQVWECDDRLQYTCFRYPSAWYTFLRAIGISSVFRRSPVLNAEELAGWERDSFRDVDVVSGMFMLVRRDALHEVGMMDEAFFVYGEEVDWCFRFKQAGWRCTFAPVGRIIHRDGGGQSTKLVSVPMFVQQIKSRMIFFDKNCSAVHSAIARAVLWGGYSLRYLVFKMLSLVSDNKNFRHKSDCHGAAVRFLLFGRSPA